MTEKREGITGLRKLASDHQLSITKLKRLGPEFGDFKEVDLFIKGLNFRILITDEYDEAIEARTFLLIYMALDALLEYKQSDDYLQWCRLFEVNASNEELRKYYANLENTFVETQHILGNFETILQQIHFQFPYRNEEDAAALLQLDR